MGREPEKIAKKQDTLEVRLVRTADILADLGRLRGSARTPVLVGFAAETSDVVARAQAKLRRKQVDLIVANDVSRSDAGFETENNAVTLITADGEQAISLQAKSQVAAAILDRVEQRLAASEPTTKRR
jgi:phosphopantothenoylcysteine decarboxylase/phosphopantothenate--cysteine ligase